MFLGSYCGVNCHQVIIELKEFEFSTFPRNNDKAEKN